MPPLTIENAGELVEGGGSPSKENAMQEKKPALVQFAVTSGFYFGGEVQEPGTTVTLPRNFAIEMQSANRGKIVHVEPTPPAAETASAAAQVAEPQSAAAPSGKGAAKERK